MAMKRKSIRKAARKPAKRTASVTRRSTRPMRGSSLGGSASMAPRALVPTGRPGRFVAELPPELQARLLEIFNRLDILVWLTRAATRVVCLHDTDGPDSQPRLSRGRKDMVLWKNHDPVTRTISFDGDCPLIGFPAAGVTLAEGENSAAYQVRQDVGNDRYIYVIDPPYMVGGGGPGEPVIIVED